METKTVKKSHTSVTALENYSKIKDVEKLVKVLLDESSDFFSVFDDEIGVQVDNRRRTIAILRIFKILFASIVENDDEDSKVILKRVFDAPFFKSDVTHYLAFLKESVKRDIKDDHKDALQGYYFYLQNLDKVYFNETDVRVFLAEEFSSFEHVCRTIKENLGEEHEFEIVEPIPRICQKPFGSGVVDDEAISDLVCNYRELPIFPTPNDINTDVNTKLKKNLIKESYQHVNHYLDTQFRLLREVLVRPLRESIQLFRQLKSKNSEKHETNGEIEGDNEKVENLDNDRNLLVYYDVFFLNSSISNSGLIFNVTFDASRLKRIDWDESSRLLPGSILCLSCNDFQDFFFVVVADRRGVEKGELSVAMMMGADNAEFFVDLFALTQSKKYVAIESVTYFEAYRHSLQCLKDFHLRMEFPFKDYIVDVSMNNDPPAYLPDRAIYNLCEMATNIRKDVREDYANTAIRKIRSLQLDKIDITKHATEIPWDLMDMDESQFNAFHAALTRKFVVIQGPPGTGKTYTALRIVQALLTNREVWCKTKDPDFSCPILILSYKNHSLDQFLEGISRFTYDRRIIRIGGDTKSKAVKKFSLYERRKNWEQKPENKGKISSLELRHRKDIYKTIRKEFNKMDSVMMEYKKIKFGYKFAGLEIESYVNGLNYNVGVQLGFAKYANLKSIKQNPDVDKELSKNIMKWLEVDELVDIDDYNRVTMELVNQSIQKTCGISEKSNESNALENEVDSDEIDARGHPTWKNLQNQRHIDPEEYMKYHEFINDTFGAGLFLNANVEEEIKKAGDEKRKSVINAALKIRDKLQSDDCMDEAEAEKVDNVKKLSTENRWRLYRYLLKLYFENVKSRFDALNTNVIRLHQELNYLKLKFDHRVCRDAWVVGMTTTGAAKYRKLVELLQPKIMIVEEAAEILEGHVVSILTNSTQHLILIGDHQQLRPIPGVEELATKYHMDISLFERMVVNGLTCFQLENQHRMRPIISSLIKPHIYKVLNDHPTVEKFESLGYTGGKHMLFVNHNHLEDKKSKKHGYSSSNVFEAEFVVELAVHFLLRGVDPSKITILTTYNAQLEKIISYAKNNYWQEFVRPPPKKCDNDDEKKRKPEYKVRISSVDGFQGEESDIVIISFVRSNKENDIGFLDIPNRVCVALSRARKGLFCFGNFESMRSHECDKCKGKNVWKNILPTVEKHNSLVNSIKLQCNCGKTKSFETPLKLKLFNGLHTKCAKCV